MQAYSDPSRESDDYALPDIEVFQLTATEVAELDDELIWEYSRKHEFRLASMNGRIREAMLDAIVENENIEGGYFYWFCFPGCLPDSSPVGPFATYADALADAQDSGE